MIHRKSQSNKDHVSKRKWRLDVKTLLSFIIYTLLRKTNKRPKLRRSLSDINVDKLPKGRIDCAHDRRFYPDRSCKCRKCGRLFTATYAKKTYSLTTRGENSKVVKLGIGNSYVEVYLHNWEIEEGGE